MFYCEPQVQLKNADSYRNTVVDLRGVRGVQMNPLWRLVRYFRVHISMSPSNDYTWSSGMQQQPLLVPY